MCSQVHPHKIGYGMDGHGIERPGQGEEDGQPLMEWIAPQAGQ